MTQGRRIRRVQAPAHRHAGAATLPGAPRRCSSSGRTRGGACAGSLTGVTLAVRCIRGWIAACGTAMGGEKSEGAGRGAGEGYAAGECPVRARPSARRARERVDAVGTCRGRRFCGIERTFRLRTTQGRQVRRARPSACRCSDTSGSAEAVLLVRSDGAPARFEGLRWP